MNTGIVKFIYGAKIALLIALFLFLKPTPAHAGGGTVTKCSDDTDFSSKLVGGGTITFNCGTATIVLSSEKTISANTTIDGGGTITLSGSNTFQLFVNSGATLTLTNITIAKGFCACDGGAIANNSGTLNIINSKFFDNHADSAHSGGAILSLGILNITNSEFGNNTAGNGGALFPRFGSSATMISGSNFHDNKTLNTTNGWGGSMLLWDGAQVTVQNSQFTNNTANSGNFSSSTIDRGGAIYVTFNSNLTVGNSQFASNSAFFGGALYVDPGGTLTLTNSELHDNSIGVFDGTQGGGAIYNAGTLTVDTSQLHDNHADGGGGGIDNASPGSMLVRNSVLRHNQAGGGGAIENGSNATVQMSTLADNSASLYGGAIDSGDHTDTSKSLTVTASTLSGNSAGSAGGAIESEMKLTLTNVTISGNTGPEMIDHYDRAISLTNVTIAQNTGKGLNLHNNPTLTLRNTLLASNSGGNCSGAITSNGFNLSSDNSCTPYFNQAGDWNNTNAYLGPLANNGGPTMTHMIFTPSKAIDNAQCLLSVPTDQRGVPRPQGSACDIGAVERLASDSDVTPATVQFSSASYTVGEGDQRVTLTVTRSGDTSAASSVGFATSDSAGSQNCNVFNGKASSRCDYLTSIGTVQFASGETSKTISIPIIDDSYAEGNETFTVSLNNASGASLGTPSATTVTIVDNDTLTGPNPVDQSSFFVRQHYLDFLNREPDTSGLNFWVNNIESCGADANCRLVSRINVSAAFFLSIEFQQTGYLVERIYKASYGDATGASTLGGAHQLSVPVVRLSEFLPDTQEIGLGVIVNQGNWQQQLENNKQAFTSEFVQRSRFTTAFATSMTPAQFVDKLFLNAGVTPSGSERTAAINEFGSATTTADAAARSRALRDVAENATLNQQEFNRAFVLMQFLGYLRRNPNDPQDPDYTGYDFWLTKLNQFNGNYINAEMVKAFISSGEYRNRFGP